MSPVRFGVIGLDHPHVYSQTAMLTGEGAELVAFHAATPAQAAGFAAIFASAAQVADEREILEDESIAVVVIACVPSERAGVAVRALRHGKDVLVDKPAATTLDQVDELRRVQRDTGGIVSVYFSERHESRATVEAAELVRGGAIGQVVQVLGLGPHRAGLESRPEWFFDPLRSGGVLCDIASHQIDQFVWFCAAEASDDVEIVSSLVANHAHPEHPRFEDYGEIQLRAGDCHGHVRVDWLSPDGLPTWGDGRLLVLGTQGYVEVRKNCDIGGRDGGDHLFLVDDRETRRIDCSQSPLPFATNLLTDVRERTETAMPQAHTLRICELAVQAQTSARRVGHLATSERPATPE